MLTFRQNQQKTIAEIQLNSFQNSENSPVWICEYKYLTANALERPILHHNVRTGRRIIMYDTNSAR